MQSAMTAVTRSGDECFVWLVVFASFMQTLFLSGIGCKQSRGGVETYAGRAHALAKQIGEDTPGTDSFPKRITGQFTERLASGNHSMPNPSSVH